MEALWTLAGNGRTVCLTIHQPRSSIFRMFDQLLLLSEGLSMYFGPAAGAVDYFSSAGFGCPSHYNPADHFLDVTSMDFRTPDSEAVTRKRVALLGELYSQQGTKQSVSGIPAGVSGCGLACLHLGIG
jgi:ABC-type multidrug transport system ATPase subunit